LWTDLFSSFLSQETSCVTGIKIDPRTLLLLLRSSNASDRLRELREQQQRAQPAGLACHVSLLVASGRD
jgi:hypothetical protein